MTPRGAWLFLPPMRGASIVSSKTGPLFLSKRAGSTIDEYTRKFAYHGDGRHASQGRNRALRPRCPRVPFWPQLPLLSYYEDMYVQASEQVPGIFWIWKSGPSAFPWTGHRRTGRRAGPFRRALLRYKRDLLDGLPPIPADGFVRAAGHRGQLEDR